MNKIEKMTKRQLLEFNAYLAIDLIGKVSRLDEGLKTIYEKITEKEDYYLLDTRRYEDLFESVLKEVDDLRRQINLSPE